MYGQQFDGVIAAAANMPAPGEKGIYTAEMFLTDFPQFTKKSCRSKRKMFHKKKALCRPPCWNCL